MAGPITLRSFELHAEDRDIISLDPASGPVQYTLKEGANYKIVVLLSSNVPVGGLSYVSTTYKNGTQVDQKRERLTNPHLISIPENGWAKTPVGPEVRGTYTVTFQIVDDNGTVLAQNDATSTIKEDW